MTKDYWGPWEDILKEEGKIDPERSASPPKNAQTNDNVDFWRDKFLEERKFVMQQLSDIKTAHTLQLHRIENSEDKIKALEKAVSAGESQGKFEGDGF